VHGALARPRRQAAQQRAAAAAQLDLERRQAHLEAQGTSREDRHDPIFHDTARTRRAFTTASHDVGRAFTDVPPLQGILQAMSENGPSRADLHVHSAASAHSRLGVQRALGLPECATPPEEVYALAKRRGMDFVTITDHDTIDGALQISDRADVFVSEELTASFRGEPQAVHVLCYGITPDDHEWLQAHRSDVDACAEYLHSSRIACALAHPFYAVGAPLTAQHRRRLARLFPVWEVRNGSRAMELNMPAAVYIDTHGGTGVGGTDDHAGVDIGRTFTETPPAANWREFLDHIRAGDAGAHGEQGSAAKWAHAAMALAIRVHGCPGGGAAPDPRAVLRMVQRVMSEGDARAGAIGADLGPQDACALLRTWLQAIDVPLDAAELLAMLQDETFSHAALYRRARRAHERGLARAVEDALAAATSGGDPAGAALALFSACIPAVPYAPATAFLAREKRKLMHREGEAPRVALVADAVGGMHGVTHTLGQIRDRGVPGFEVEIVGTDAIADRRLSAVTEVDIPFYGGLKVGVPSVPAIVEALSDGRYDLVHLCSPGPAGAAAAIVARMTELPVVGSYHTELAAYTALRTDDPRLALGAQMAIAAFYGQCRTVLSPSAASDAVLAGMGIAPERIGRWDRGVDTHRFRPDLRDEALLPGELNVLYAGRLTTEKGVSLLADAFLAARERDPRLHLCLAGGGPEESALRERLGAHATFLGWLQGDDLARTYASADIFLFASRTDTFGQVLLEAQASGLPVVAVAEGGPCELVEDGVTGLLRPPDAAALARAVLDLARVPAARRRLARAGRQAVAERSWERALAHLADGYRRALGEPATAAPERRVA
jgi:glycosyltransferase involved in cell wall biosynthesis/predicted metal-dependent phosphoesterase TrpH